MIKQTSASFESWFDDFQEGQWELEQSTNWRMKLEEELAELDARLAEFA